VSMGPVALAEPPGADPLLTRMCSPPSCRAASATVRSTCSLLVTSAASGTTRRFVSCASSRAVASRSDLLRATIATSTPSRANSRAMALPMPRLPPVTIACLPCNPRSMSPPPTGGPSGLLRQARIQNCRPSALDGGKRGAHGVVQFGDFFDPLAVKAEMAAQLLVVGALDRHPVVQVLAGRDAVRIMMHVAFAHGFVLLIVHDDDYDRQLVALGGAERLNDGIVEKRAV